MSKNNISDSFIKEQNFELNIFNIVGNLLQIQSQIFSRNDNNPYFSIIEYFNKEKKEFSKILAIHESLEFYKNAFYELKDKKIFNLFEMTWISNATSEIIILINDILDNIILKDFQNSINLKEYEDLHDFDQKYINEISSSRKLKDKNTYNEKIAFYDFIISIRNFLIHKNSEKYKYIFFSKKPKLNILDFQNIWDRKEGFSREKYLQNKQIHIFIFLKYLNSFLIFVIKNKEKIIIFFEKKSKKLLKNLKIETFLNYLSNPKKYDNQIYKDCENHYHNYHININDFLFYNKNTKKNKEEIDLLIKIIFIHFKKIHYDVDFFKFIDTKNDYKKISNLKNHKSLFYCIKDLKNFPEYFEERFPKESAFIKIKYPKQNLYNGWKLMSCNFLLEKKNFKKIIKKYFEYCCTNKKELEKDISFKKFMENHF